MINMATETIGVGNDLALIVRYPILREMGAELKLSSSGPLALPSSEKPPFINKRS